MTVLLGDLREVKALLQILPNDTRKDVVLTFLIEMASAWIEELLGRTGFLDQKSRTEYYAGTGTQRLLLRARPVLPSPTIVVYVDDEGGFYGSKSGSFSSGTTQTYGDDFCLDIDSDDGTSRSGILVRINSFWPKPAVRQVGYLSPFIGSGFGNIKITYTGGYTVANLPSQLRMACNILVAKLDNLFPLGMVLTSESYEERHIAYYPHKKPLLDLIKPMLTPFMNRRWG